MGLLDRLKRLFGLGGETTAETDETADDRADGTTDATRECSVCGTTVDAAAEECPLCHSTDLVSPDADADPESESEEGSGPGLDPDSATTTTTADGSDTLAASERLADLRQERDEE